MLQVLAVCFAHEKCSLERAVFSHEETNIPLEDKVIKVQLPVRHPKFDIQFTSSLNENASHLQKMWRTPSYRRHLKFTNTGKKFIMDWLLREPKQEINYAEKDLAEIKRVVFSFLKGTKTAKTKRGQRALGNAAAVAGAVGLFSTNIMFGASETAE